MSRTGRLFESKITKIVASMMVRDVGDRMCWLQVLNVGDRSRGKHREPGINIVEYRDTIFGPPLSLSSKWMVIRFKFDMLWPELGGHGHVLNGHRCPCPRHGHGRGMDTKFLENRGVDMDMDTEGGRRNGRNFFSLWMWHHTGRPTTDHCAKTIGINCYSPRETDDFTQTLRF